MVALTILIGVLEPNDFERIFLRSDEKNKLIYGNTKGREVDRDARRKGAGMPK
jgi:hypothetical protein